MGKRSRIVAHSRPAAEVAPRQPCPCGSGRRYKACHGRDGNDVAYVVRTFEGLPGECDWVAIREFVPTASAPVVVLPSAFASSGGDGISAGEPQRAVVTSLLPGISAADVTSAGVVRVALQVRSQSSDPSRDIAEALRLALMAEPGSSITINELPGPGPRLQDVLDPDHPFTVTVHDGYDFWYEGEDVSDAAARATLDNINASVRPTRRLQSVDAAYWTSVGTKEHLRWVMPHDEDALLTALARLHVRGRDRIGGSSRLVGSFRAHGLLVPVWDLPNGTGAEALEEEAAAFAERIGDALATTAPLTSDERAARQGLTNRQVTIR